MTSYPVPGLTLAEQPGGILLRICLWEEARGEQDEGGRLESVAMFAVARVVYTRAQKQGKSIKDIILAHRQFSWTEDKQRAKALLAHRLDPTSWERADTVADLIESGDPYDPTNGADHYYNPKVATPAWGRGHPEWHETAQLGNHIFGVCP